jgi:hypothetical protein
VPYPKVNRATVKVLKEFTAHSAQQAWIAPAITDRAFHAWAAKPSSDGMIPHYE